MPFLPRQTVCSLLATLAFGCTASKPSDSGAPGSRVDPSIDGPHAVTVLRSAATDTAPPTWIWGPADTAPRLHALPELEPDASRADLLAERIATAPVGCPSSGLSLTMDAPLLDGAHPVVLMSHCHECTATSLATIARRLATWGVVVIAPSHEGNTFYDRLAGTGLPLHTDTLALRVAQLDAAFEAAAATLTLDTTRVATVGHSFGAVTTGLVAQRTGAVVGSVFLGAPADNPLLPGVDADALTAPNVWLLLEEDHSIGTIGNDLIEDNAARAPGPTRLVRMPDGGHWSVSDIVGIDEAFMPGCGTDTRQDGSGEPFSYPDPATARQTTASLVAAAVLPWLLKGDPGVSGVDALDRAGGLVVEGD